MSLYVPCAVESSERSGVGREAWSPSPYSKQCVDDKGGSLGLVFHGLSRPLDQHLETT